MPIYISSIFFETQVLSHSTKPWTSVQGGGILLFLDFSVIRTQIAGLEGEHADHLTTTTAMV